MMYQEKGMKTVERLWDETMEELEFSNAKEIMESLK